MTDTYETIKDLVKEFEDLRKDFRKKGEKLLKTAFKEFFSANPKIKQIYWTQYTPYFNDGDECTFNVHDFYANVGEKDYDFAREHEIEDNEGTMSHYSTTPGFEPEQKAFKKFVQIMNTLPDEIYKDTFGDHCQVIANRKGFDVEEYEHD